MRCEILDVVDKQFPKLNLLNFKLLIKTHTHTHTHTFTHKNTHIYSHIHTHIHVPVSHTCDTFLVIIHRSRNKKHRNSFCSYNFVHTVFCISSSRATAVMYPKHLMLLYSQLRHADERQQPRNHLTMITASGPWLLGHLH